MGEISTIIAEAIDLTPFTPAFLVSLQDDALYMPETPGFLQYATTPSRQTAIMVQAMKDIYEKLPYECVIEPYFNLDQTWKVARANDFIKIKVLGLDLKK